MTNQEMWIALAFFWIMGTVLSVGWVIFIEINIDKKHIAPNDPWWVNVIGYTVTVLILIVLSWIIVVVIIRKNINWKKKDGN